MASDNPEIISWTLQDTLQYYQQFAAKYDDHCADLYAAPEMLYSWVLDYLELKDSCTLFNVLDEVFKVTGIDASPDMLKRAKTLAFHRLICQDIEAPLALSDRFNVVICVGTTDFLHAPQKLLKSLVAHLDEKHCLAMTFPENKNAQMNSYSLQELCKLIDDCGYAILRNERIVGYEDSTTGLIVYYWIVLFTSKI